MIIAIGRKSNYKTLSKELQLEKICFSAIKFKITYIPDYVKITESFLWWNEKTDRRIDYKNI
jgi:hypothetical protein